MDKKVAVVTGDVIHDILVRPGTTTRDIVKQLELPSDFALSKRDGVFFGDNEDVYGSLRDGEKVFASTVPTVGRIGAR